MRPISGVRYALDRKSADEKEVIYEGFAHLPEDDIPLCFRVELPGGAVTPMAVSSEDPPHDRTIELTKAANALVRAATKTEVTALQPLPRKIVRWRA